MASDYDVLVIGGGLAGMTSGMYAARHGLRVGVIERMMGGASIINVEKVENYPGFPEGIMGADLAAMTQEQAMNAGADFVMGEVSGIAEQGDYRVVDTDAGEFRGQVHSSSPPALHCACWASPGKRNLWAGASRNAPPATARSTAARSWALPAAATRRPTRPWCCRSTPTGCCCSTAAANFVPKAELVDRVLADPKIEVVWNTVIDEVLGEDTVSGVRVTNIATGEQGARELSGLFVYVGLTPNAGFAGSMLQTDGGGHIPVNVSMETAVPGVYAVGDIRQHSSSQLVSAAGDGATAAIAAYRYISSKSWA